MSYEKPPNLSSTRADTKEGFADPLAYTTTNGEGIGEAHITTVYDDNDRPDIWTRLGVSPSSFKRRTVSDKHNQLNKTLKTRLDLALYRVRN